MNPEFLVVAHRLPLKIDNNSLVPTDGGLASALRSAQLESKARWVGCLGENADDSFVSQLPSHCSNVPIPSEIFKNFYNGYSNSVLWPAFHDRLDLMRFRDEDWSAYFEANAHFASTILDSSKQELPVWLHDYQLMMVPLLLKLHQPQRKVSFFLHIPWPELKVAKKIPRLSEIIRSLAKCDRICVHTAEYAKNMQDYYEYINEGRFPSRKELPIHTLPIGIEPEQFNCSELSDTKDFEWKGQKAKWKGVNIVGVDRLDYSKGLDHKLEVFAEFLELNPSWRGKVTLRQLLIPSREDVLAYKIHKQEVFELAEYINLKFGTADWMPVDIWYGRTNSENLKKIYCNGDYCWVASRKDGMNLVALEYVAAQDAKKPGLLILSDRTGCAQHLDGALTFDGIKDVSCYKALRQALEMSDAEKVVRHRRDFNWIKTHSVRDWVEKNLEFLISPAESRKPKVYERKDTNVAFLHPV